MDLDRGQLFALVWGVSFWAAVIIGARKGEGIGMGLVALIFGPLAIPLAILSKGNKLPCPWCGEKIRAKAIVCRHCGRNV